MQWDGHMYNLKHLNGVLAVLTLWKCFTLTLFWPFLNAKNKTDGLKEKKCFSLSSLTVLSGYVDVEVQAVLALVLNVRRCGIQVVGEPHRQHDLGQNPMHILGTDRRKLCGVADLLPRARSFRRLEAALSDGRGGIWHSEVLFHRGQDLIVELSSDASYLSVARGHDGVLQVDPLARGEHQVEHESQEQQQTATGHPLRAAPPTAALVARGMKREKQHVQNKSSSWHIRKSSTKREATRSAGHGRLKIKVKATRGSADGVRFSRVTWRSGEPGNILRQAHQPSSVELQSWSQGAGFTWKTQTGGQSVTYAWGGRKHRQVHFPSGKVITSG